MEQVKRDRFELSKKYNVDLRATSEVIRAFEFGDPFDNVMKLIKKIQTNAYQQAKRLRDQSVFLAEHIMDVEPEGSSNEIG